MKIYFRPCKKCKKLIESLPDDKKPICKYCYEKEMSK